MGPRRGQHYRRRGRNSGGRRPNPSGEEDPTPPVDGQQPPQEPPPLLPTPSTQQLPPLLPTPATQQLHPLLLTPRPQQAPPSSETSNPFPPLPTASSLNVDSPISNLNEMQRNFHIARLISSIQGTERERDELIREISIMSVSTEALRRKVKEKEATLSDKRMNLRLLNARMDPDTSGSRSFLPGSLDVSINLTSEIKKLEDGVYFGHLGNDTTPKTLLLHVPPLPLDVLSSLKHPLVVKIYDLIEYDYHRLLLTENLRSNEYYFQGLGIPKGSPEWPRGIPEHVPFYHPVFFSWQQRVKLVYTVIKIGKRSMSSGKLIKEGLPRSLRSWKLYIPNVESLRRMVTETVVVYTPPNYEEQGDLPRYMRNIYEHHDEFCNQENLTNLSTRELEEQFDAMVPDLPSDMFEQICLILEQLSAKGNDENVTILKKFVIEELDGLYVFEDLNSYSPRDSDADD